MRRMRLLLAAAFSTVCITALTLALAHVRPAPNLPTDLLLFLAIVVGSALIGGFVAGTATALVSFPVIIWFLTIPLHTFRVEGTEDIAALAVFFFVAIVVSALVDQVVKRSADAESARIEVAVQTRAAAEAAAAAEGDRLRTAILRAVSHDLRTPLASIKASSTSLLQEDIDWTPENRREFAMTIDEEADRLDRIVGNLLDLSRLEAGVVHPQLSEVGVAAALHESISSLGADEANFESEIVGSDIAVVADPVLLERALANLASNAVRYGASSEPIQVRVRCDSSFIAISIADHGPGMNVEDRSRAIEPFTQLGDRSRGAGTGLGLAVASGFVEAMGGRLSLEETEGGGLTAVVRLASASGPNGLRARESTQS